MYKNNTEVKMYMLAFSIKSTQYHFEKLILTMK